MDENVSSVGGMLQPFRACPHLQRALQRARYAKRVPVSYRPWLPLYAPEKRKGFVPAGSDGPWVVTQRGSVLYDASGYGMLSFGHAPAQILAALAEPVHQANLATPHPAQTAFSEAVAPHLPGRSLACLNSGSEANSLALRIANMHRRPRSVVVTVRHSFHGRTERPAMVSESSAATYRTTLAEYRRPQPVRVVELNSVESVHATFDALEREGVFPECTVLEPVLGEGLPATAVTPSFYGALHRRTHAAGGLVLVDSVQAGLRCHGVLSVCDYPGFETQPAPDMETFSKAIHGGQFPVSLLAVGGRARWRYTHTVYGNTLTANARGLAVATACLEAMTPHVRSNVVEMGRRLRVALEEVCCPHLVEAVRGVGLLLALQLRPTVDPQRVVDLLLQAGLVVAEGGHGCVRLTPWFHMSAREVELVAVLVGEVLGPRGRLQRRDNCTPVW